MSDDDDTVKEFRNELDEPPCYICGSYFCDNFDYCDRYREDQR